MDYDSLPRKGSYFPQKLLVLLHLSIEVKLYGESYFEKNLDKQLWTQTFKSNREGREIFLIFKGTFQVTSANNSISGSIDYHRDK